MWGAIVALLVQNPQILQMLPDFLKSVVGILALNQITITFTPIDALKPAASSDFGDFSKSLEELSKAITDALKEKSIQT